jgi:hypothetical protein
MNELRHFLEDLGALQAALDTGTSPSPELLSRCGFSADDPAEKASIIAAERLRGRIRWMAEQVCKAVGPLLRQAGAGDAGPDCIATGRLKVWYGPPQCGQ